MAHRIIVYEASAPGSEAFLFVAGLCLGSEQQPRWYCSGATAEAARAKMEAFWAREQRSYGLKAEEPEPAALAVVMDDPGDVI